MLLLVLHKDVLFHQNYKVNISNWIRLLYDKGFPVLTYEHQLSKTLHVLIIIIKVFCQSLNPGASGEVWTL